MSTNKVGFISLGCPKALVDSERILTQLQADGYQIVPDYHSAQVVIVNTCGFIDDAKAESIETIGEALEENGQVIVTGCLGSDEAQIRQHHPNVLHVSGPQAYEEVVSAVHRQVPPPTKNPFIDLVPKTGVKLTPRHYAYLKIAEGCNHQCRFCIIPSMRGKLVSRPIGEVMQEAESLVEAGVKELLVIAQDTSAYGVDLKYRTDFWNGRPLKTRLFELCDALGSLGEWVRLHYIYPYPHVDEVIPLMAEKKILPYLDIPLQHGSPTVLKRMRRPAFTENTLKRIATWRAICPDITLRSTFIVGFPGETDAEFEQLLQFIEEAQLDRVGCFTYSAVEGAAANALPGAIPDEIKQQRYDLFMSVQQRISEQKLEKKIGQNIEIIIDEIQSNCVIARSTGDAPEIDGQVFLEYSSDLRVGEKVWARVVRSDAYDMWAEPIEKE